MARQSGGLGFRESLCPRFRIPELAIERGQLLAQIGEYAPNNYHLHFDISPDTILKRLPGHWPGDNAPEVMRYYTDPMAFLRRYHVVRA